MYKNVRWLRATLHVAIIKQVCLRLQASGPGGTRHKSGQYALSLV